MGLFDDYYFGLTKKERRLVRKKEREAETAALKRNRVLRRLFFWVVFILLALTSGYLLVKIANQNPYKP
ncbi:MAG: hypothetical protein HYT63_00120 [Candidatus Yanofskybacteria bacterium]|nr:hypothetical protein [Candidatus Yanofskybacteria bacterium]